MSEQNLPDELDEEATSIMAWNLPWDVQAPGYLLAVILVVPFLFSAATNPYGMLGWGVSGQTLAQGRYYTLLTHMFAHGGLLHIVLNLSALIPISSILVANMGRPPGSWWRYYTLFLASGLAGAFAYLALNPTGAVPMLGASGAIYGLLGTLLRLGPGGEVVPIRSHEIARAAKEMVKQNLFLVALFALPILFGGKGAGLAWESHLGGVVFGLFAGPFFLPPPQTASVI